MYFLSGHGCGDGMDDEVAVEAGMKYKIKSQKFSGAHPQQFGVFERTEASSDDDFAGLDVADEDAVE